MANLREFLLGEWKLDRVIFDEALALPGKLVGRARFTASSFGLVYHEWGALELGDHRGYAEQTYLYEFPESDARACVRFRDRRAFHELQLTAGQDRVGHACHPDLYEGKFEAISKDAWRSEWKVAGPRKRYTLVTSYTRPGEQLSSLRLGG